MAGVSLVSGKQVDSRVELLDGWDVFSPALYLELRRVISFLMVGICGSFRWQHLRCSPLVVIALYLVNCLMNE
jgi:hypothetical protein